MRGKGAHVPQLQTLAQGAIGEVVDVCPQSVFEVYAPGLWEASHDGPSGHQRR